MNARSNHVHPVILSGGSGTRLWPISRKSLPKQLLPLVSKRTMLQDTALRVSGDGFAPPVIICNAAHRFIVEKQMQEISVVPSEVVLEPEGRNTAPAACVAALLLSRQDPSALLLLLASDHVITDVPAFHRALAVGVQAAEQGKLVTFGITPNAPATGYGYIRQGAPMPGVEGAFGIEAFVEKPDLAIAQSYLDHGGYHWNSGMFLFRADCLLAELAVHEPALLASCTEAVSASGADLDFCRLDKKLFGQAKKISIDYAVMERTGNAVVVPADIGWSDVGSWPALADILPKDEAGNTVQGDVILRDTRNCYVRSDNRLVAAMGVSDLAIVSSDDAILVTSKDRAQDVKAIVDILESLGRPESDTHSCVYRPWGSYTTLSLGARYQVKMITVHPGARLSLQYHHHRAEHWVVVQGTARVYRNDQSFLLDENESTYIPLGEVHRLENPGRIPLCVIEVQSGAYLGEDDIVRLEDQYQRTDHPAEAD